MIANRVIFSRKHRPKIAVLSILVHVLTAVIAWCVVQSIAAPVLFGQIFQLVPPVMLITMLPISIAGWGVREATMGLAFGYAGLVSNESVNISLVFGAVNFLVGAFAGWCGFSVLKRPRRAPSRSRRANKRHGRCTSTAQFSTAIQRTSHQAAVCVSPSQSILPSPLRHAGYHDRY